MDFYSLNKEDKIDFYIAIAVITLASLFILYYSFSISGTDASYMNIAINDNVQDIDELVIDESKYKPLSEDYDQRDLVLESEKIETKKVSKVHRMASNNKNEYNSGLAIIESEDTVRIGIDDMKPGLDAVKSQRTLTKIDSFINQKATPEETKNDISKLPSEVEVVNNTSEILKSSKDCIIIVGAFTKQRNIDKLKKGLKNDGYELFSTPYKKSTRIGVYQPCNTQSIRKNLSIIRKKYAKDAMILRAE